LLQRVKEAIEAIENADSFANLPNVKRLKGSRNYFRQRVGDYRLGLALGDNTVILVRFLNRKDVYKYFPRERQPLQVRRSCLQRSLKG
jgi:mRNA interferase RelE/StbE